MAEGEDVLSLMLYTVLVYPVCKWIMGSKRFGKRSVWYAMALLAAVAAVHIAWEWRERGPNHYQLLGVGREATPLEIKKAYKRASLELHPDKNPSPEAVDQFAEMKDAYEVLMDQEFRDIYNKLGPEAIRTKQRMDETELLLAIGAQYVVWGVIAYLLTMGAAGAAARAAVFTGEIAMIVGNLPNRSKSATLPARTSFADMPGSGACKAPWEHLTTYASEQPASSSTSTYTPDWATADGAREQRRSMPNTNKGTNGSSNGHYQDQRQQSYGCAKAPSGQQQQRQQRQQQQHQHVADDYGRSSDRLGSASGYDARMPHDAPQGSTRQSSLQDRCTSRGGSRGGSRGNAGSTPYSTGGAITAPYGGAEGQPQEYADVQLQQCPDCGRRFNEKAYGKHVSVCRQVFLQKRKAFDAAKMRVAGTEMAEFTAKTSGGRGGVAAARRAASAAAARSSSAANGDDRPLAGGGGKSAKWRQQSAAFREAIRSARMVTQAQAKGIPLARLPAAAAAPPDPSLVPCPHCARRFNEAAAERHIPRCSSIRAQPSRLAKGSGRGLGVASRKPPGPGRRL